jgi:hypothetical protein
MGGTCAVKFKAKKADDDTWMISNAPTCHSCSAPALPKLTSLVTLKDSLSEALIQEVERLGVTVIPMMVAVYTVIRIRSLQLPLAYIKVDQEELA